ncbi:hypothetical protein [Peribacillus huizhouensis]|uniref:Transcription initiation factor TFIIIB Brf1 subunit/transcription initiation factor TFIIB n=1 Tax=Peribacillus huizhouensis TaxID=1501239 RepID=A0ABR6CRJ2_9BACI|nr:hypothetical protein [Peribacillus huizhouensis]MBA9027649.1 transcription initiation factor TFIIIB Brf1 subunit/transcription initiation factor TFIIB [Peribacillus huizhouensis]
METFILFYKIHHSNVKPIDYINWALKMLESDCSSFSLNILSSLGEPLNIFEVEHYFRKALNELDIQEPSYKECAEFYIQYLSKKIIKDENNAIDIAYQIYVVARDLDYPEDLEEWCNISEMIDDFRYGDNQSKLSKVSLIVTIVKEAKNHLRRHSK